MTQDKTLKAETLEDYITMRLTKADMTSFVNLYGNTQNITTEDALARISESHTLPNGMQTYSNQHRDDDILSGMARFYENSLICAEPMTANAIICKSDKEVPEGLRKIVWYHSGWLIFNEKTGLLTDKWWHLYGKLS